MDGRRSPHALLFVASALVATAAPTGAEAADGKWTPKQLRLVGREIQKDGLRVPLQRLWDERTGAGLAAAAVNLSGCSGALISADGLVITNHHCVFSIIQEHARPDRDLLADGFLARTRAAELPGKAARLQLPRAFTDVTDQVLRAVPAGADDLIRQRAIDRAQKELVATCESKPATRCSVAVFGGGLEYTLVEAMELADVRLVYAPPRAVGDFGGEVDDWSWPRHSGDFAIVRAYVSKDGKPAPSSPDNVPLHTATWLPLSTAGVGEGDFVMILGYPGSTSRELLAEEMAFRRDRVFPAIIEVYGEYLSILESVTDPEGKLAVASQVKSLGNRVKNARGQLAGLARGRTVERQAETEAEVLKALTRAADGAEATRARAALLEELEVASRTQRRELLIAALAAGGPRALGLASTVARLATEREKPDLERDPDYMERELPRLFERLEREQRNLFLPIDERLTVAWVRRALTLAPGQRFEVVDRLFGASAAEADVAKKVHELYVATKVLDLAERKRLVTLRPDELHAQKDPLLELGFGLATELDHLKETKDRRLGASARLRPTWRRAVLALSRRPIAPDANGTLRASWGRVRGYTPRDGVRYTPHSTLAGLLAKDTHQDPFQVPERVARTASAGRLGRWRDAKLGDVPVCFLADLDTTGGNSGSPVINAKGELVGVNFDRVWENVANDFGYDSAVARNISVNVRYVGWLLDQVEDAGELLAELGVKRGR